MKRKFLYFCVIGVFGLLYAHDDYSPETYNRYNKGVDCYEIGDYAKAVEYWAQVAELGFVNAQYNLAVCYDNGYGVAKDFEKAVYWYDKAAQQNDLKSQYNLGVHYYNGKGVTKDYKMAVYWYTKAAERGFPDAQVNLGVCYENGLGVEVQSYSRAVIWYRKAAEQGLAIAQYNLGVCYERGNGIEQNEELAIKWYLLSAKQGNVDAQKALKKLNNKDK